MSLRAWMLLFVGLVALALLGCGWLFWVQNSAQPVTVSFELWGLGRRGKALTASELMAISAGVGLAVGLLLPSALRFIWRMGARREDPALDLPPPREPTDAKAWR